MATSPKIYIAAPAWNCADTIEEVIRQLNELDQDLKILVVDDHSTDDTLERAQKYDTVIAARNTRNMGYGGTSKRLYQMAQDHKADFVINVHGDLGHRPKDVLHIIEGFRKGAADFVIGSRLIYIRQNFAVHGFRVLFKPELRGDMPLVRLLGHLGLTFIQNILFAQKLNSYHEGMRGCSAKAVDWILKQELPDWYDFDTTLLVSAASAGFKIKEVAVAPHYHHASKSSAPPFRYGWNVLIKSIRNARRFRRLRYTSQK